MLQYSANACNTLGDLRWTNFLLYRSTQLCLKGFNSVYHNVRKLIKLLGFLLLPKRCLALICETSRCGLTSASDAPDGTCKGIYTKYRVPHGNMCTVVLLPLLVRARIIETFYGSQSRLCVGQASKSFPLFGGQNSRDGQFALPDERGQFVSGPHDACNTRKKFERIQLRQSQFSYERSRRSNLLYSVTTTLSSVICLVNPHLP